MTVSCVEATAAARRIAEWPAYMATDSTYRRDAELLAAAWLARRDDTERIRAAIRSLASETCREWVGGDRCNSPAEFLLWGKFFASAEHGSDGLGPRCYDHAAVHAGHRALGDPQYAIVDLRPFRAALAGVSA